MKDVDKNLIHGDAYTRTKFLYGGALNFIPFGAIGKVGKLGKAGEIVSKLDKLTEVEKTASKLNKTDEALKLMSSEEKIEKDIEKSSEIAKLRADDVLKDGGKAENGLNKGNEEIKINDRGENVGVGETNAVRYSPANPGPLSQDVAETFTGGSYTQTVLTEDTTFYRVYGGDAQQVGSYMSRTSQNGGIQSQIDLALKPEWGNTTEHITKVTVPKGTVIYEGTAAPQTINETIGGTGKLIGGGNQVYIPRGELNAEWFGN